MGIFLGAVWPDNSSAEKDLGVLLENKVMSASQLYSPLVAKANSSLGSWNVKAGDPSLLFSSGQATFEPLCPMLDLPVRERS